MNLTCAEVVAKFPKHFSGPRQIECDDGWADLINEFIEQLDKLPGGKEVVFFSIKEKFGRLRIDTMGIEPPLDYAEYNSLELAYERQSALICERCGEPGKVRDGVWIKTLCDLHENERHVKDRA